MHISGNQYIWLEPITTVPLADLPVWVTEKLKKKTHVVTAHKESQQDYSERAYEWSHDDVRGMLSHLDPGCTRTEWIEVGMALQDGGYPMIMWDEWSKRDANLHGKYDPAELMKQWASFKPEIGRAHV